MENKILNLAFKNREAFDTLQRYFTTDNFSGHTKILYTAIKEYYQHDPAATECAEDIILSKIEREHPKHIETFRMIIQRFTDPSVPNLIKEILEIRKHQVAHELSGVLLAGGDATELIQQYQEILAGTLPEQEQDTQVSEGLHVQSFCEAFSEQNLVKVYPHTLNDRLGGGVPRQTHIVIFAEPECGKSLMAINIAAGFCREGYRVLYVENEDAHASTGMRFTSRMSEMTRQEILADADTAERKAVDKGANNLVLVSTSPGTISEIEGLIQKYHIDCLIVNQIRHLYFKGVDGEVQQLTAAGKAMRSLIKRYNLVGLSIHQAADSATNKLVLQRGDCYMSNTSLPGDADVLIGIGVNQDFKSQGRRMLSLIKNKPGNNHDFFPVLFDEQLSKVISV